MKLRKLKKLVQEHHGFGYTQKLCSSYEWGYYTKILGSTWHCKKVVMPKGTMTSWKKHQWKLYYE